MYDYTWKTVTKQIPIFPLLTCGTLPEYWNLFILPILLIYTHYLCGTIKLDTILIVKEWPLPQFFPFMQLQFYPMIAAITGQNIL